MHSTQKVSFLQRIKSIFISPSENHLRIGWRSITLLIILFFLSSLFLIPYLLFSGFFQLPAPLDLFLIQFIQCIASTLAVLFCVHFLVRGKFSSLGLKITRITLPDLLVGFLIALVSIAGVFILEVLLGLVDIDGSQIFNQSSISVFFGILISLITFILVGWSEELVFRGYLVKNLSIRSKPIVGMVLSSLLFALFHLANPHANWFAFLGIFLAGLLLSFAYFRTGQLWLPIGFHIGWNFSEGVLFGFPVSGLDGFKLIQTTSTSHPLLTGGEFGPEGGLIIIFAFLIGFLLLLYYSKNRPNDNYAQTNTNLTF